MISQKHAENLLQKANVNLVAQGHAGLIIGVEKKVLKKELSRWDIIPRFVAGEMTDVVEVGTIRAMNTGKYRPAPGGVSMGHHAITTGTLGMLAKHGDIRVALSNNHVFANSNDAKIGDHIYQPGPYDGGTTSDLIAYLYRYVPITFESGNSNCWFSKLVANILNAAWWMSKRKTRFKAIDSSVVYNLVDCALAIGVEMNGDQFKNEILDLGIPKRFGEVRLGDRVIKSGRTTGITTGEVTGMDAYVSVQYGAGKIAHFKDQFITGRMLDGGDSGSVAALQDDPATIVGLGFAGSDKVGIFNHIANVRALLGGLEVI